MRRVAFVLLLLAIVPPPGKATDLRLHAERIRSVTDASHECVLQSISCGQTRSGRITSHDCFLSSVATYADLIEFNGTAGARVTIQLNSTEFDAIAVLLGPNNESAIDDDSGGGTNARIVHTLESSGDWVIGVTTNASFDTGAYTVSLTCGSQPPPPPTSCNPSSTAMCLNGNRFRVEATFETPQGASGSAQVVKLTDDSGYLWFFNAANIEAVVKVINACSLANPRFWVFAGGLTNVRVVLTVTDTETGQVKTYTNPQRTAFQPIQDTGAFATCP